MLGDEGMNCSFHH